MKKGISICDKCKKEVIVENPYDTPKGWRIFTVRDNFSRSFAGTYDSYEMMLCDECYKKINLTEATDTKNIKDELFNIIYSMLEEIAQQGEPR